MARRLAQNNVEKTTMATPRKRPFRLDLMVGAAGLALSAVSLASMSATAGVPADVSDGSDWGAQGLLQSDSEVTARWDNTGNADTSLVPRNQRQVLPHTPDKNYFDISNTVLDAYESHFGKTNGRGGMQVNVSQTSDLVNQAVTVSIEGVDPDIPTGQVSRSYLQIFQCWGAMGADGRPDPNASSPDPATCQVGAGGPDSAGGSLKREYRVVGADPLVPGGDWDQYVSQGLVEVPFLSINGEESGPNLSLQNTFFNKTTTNELSHVVLPESGSTSRQFELQTGVESQGLGCGARADDVSTSTCWLVVVPRIEGVLDDLGPTSPSVWGQRVQVQLGFRDIVTSCGKGSRSLLGGSEMLADAAASWIPGVCDAEGASLGYTRLGDEVARNQFRTGSSDAVLTSEPISSATAVHVPLSVTGPVFAYNVDYRPVCSDGSLALAEVETNEQAQQCGYTDVAEVRADVARAGQPIRELRLNARLVAKLLTQSYQNSIIGCGPDCVSAVNAETLPEWTVERPTSLTADPEFRALNPQLHLGESRISEPILEAARSDAAASVWKWLMADPDAAAFLAGCPDAAGVVINPYYSTRTYSGCAGDAATLTADAVRNRAETVNPSGFVDVAQSYPPTGSPFPLPNWQQEPAQGERPPRTLVDHLPRVDIMQIAARDAFVGYKPRNSEFCRFDLDPSCFPPPGKWKDPKALQRFGEREIFALTDAASAARFKLPTAYLCGGSGGNCVSAGVASMQKAASRFASSTGGVKSPTLPPDYAGGAYPLTLPVYAVVRTTLAQSSRDAYADALEYITGRGQRPGYVPGDLPPGYAPLTPALQADAASALSALRKALPVTASAKPSDAASEEASAEPSATESTSAAPTDGGGEGGAPAAEAPGSGEPPSAAAAPSAAPTAPGVVTEATTPVAAGTETWPGYLFPLGVALTLAAGLFGPFMRRRTSLRLAARDDGSGS